MSWIVFTTIILAVVSGSCEASTGSCLGLTHDSGASVDAVRLDPVRTGLQLLGRDVSPADVHKLFAGQAGFLFHDIAGKAERYISLEKTFVLRSLRLPHRFSGTSPPA